MNPGTTIDPDLLVDVTACPRVTACRVYTFLNMTEYTFCVSLRTGMCATAQFTH